LVGPGPTRAGVFASRSINVARFDDGLTLDSFARSLSSVNKAYLDGSNFFGEQFGTRGPMSRGEFEFKRSTQNPLSSASWTMPYGQAAVNDPKGPIEAGLLDAVCDPTPTSWLAIRLWHPCVDV